MQTYLEKEMAERTRQYGLMRKFFDRKKAMLDARQALFLHRYPYIGVGIAVIATSIRILLKRLTPWRKF